LVHFASPGRPWDAFLALGAPAQPKLVQKVDFWRFAFLIGDPEWSHKSIKIEVKKRFVFRCVFLPIWNDFHSILEVKNPHFLKDF
jgi:hypothetical protein